MASNRDGLRLIALTRLARDERRVALAIKRVLDKHKPDTYALVASLTAASAPTDPFDLTSWESDVVGIVLPTVEDVVADLGTSVLARLGISHAEIPTYLNRINLSNQAASFVERIKGMGPQVASDLHVALQTGVGHGEGIGELRDRVQGVFESGDYSAERIARTEVHGASEETSLTAVQTLASDGMEATKSWLATEDNVTRETHSDADGQEVGINEQYEVGDSTLDYPGDPNGDPAETVNCRCSQQFALPGGQENGSDASVEE